MKEEDFGRDKIYKNTNPSSILDFVGNKLRRKNSLKRPPHIINYQRNRTNLYSNPTLDPIINKKQKITLLIPVFERHVTDEESSSNGSKKSKKEVIKYKNSFKQYKSENANNYQFNKNNIIYNSSNTLYNYKSSNRNIRNNNYLNSINWINDNNNNIDNYSQFKDELYSNINLNNSNNSFDEKSLFELDEYLGSDGQRLIGVNNNIKKQKHKDFQEKVKEIKIEFYVIISFFYLSLYLLSLKIALKLPMPKIPSLGVSLFIISFNNIIISLLFMKLDQINFQSFIKFKFENFLITILFNYLKVLLVIKSLQNLNLLTFVLIINMTPLVISYISIRENNQSFKYSDYIYYIIFLIICLTEFLIQNKISMICTFTLMILDSFTFLAKINVIKNIHSYLINFWSSLIGIAISPIIMSINEDYLNISISQYLLFIIICFTYFLNHYFSRKFTLNSLGQGFQILLNALIFVLYIIYSNFILRENNKLYSYLFLALSFFIFIHAKLRIEFNDI